MGLLDGLFGKKPHDPAQALTDWLSDKPVACRRQVADSCGARNHGGQITRWIVTRPDCDRGTAARVFWEAMISAPAELANVREHPSTPTPHLDLVKLIGERWKAGSYAPPQQGLDTGDYWADLVKKLRKHRLSMADFDLPADIRDPVPGERFSYWAFWSPNDQREGQTLDDLLEDLKVCDLAIEMPEQWLPIRKKRLGY